MSDTRKPKPAKRGWHSYRFGYERKAPRPKKPPEPKPGERK